MNAPGSGSLWHYATPPNNFLGAFIFLSYIVAALYACFTISYMLYIQYTAIFPTTKKDGEASATKALRARQIKIYAFLACLSFAMLSYNMLMFLITHYSEWSGQKRFSLSEVSSSKLGRWMLESSLFQDFARDLVKTAPNAVWSQIAILSTWDWNIWMALKARQYNFDRATMRTFILLSQILPISLTAVLFIIKLHLASSDTHSADPKLPTTRSQGESKLPLQLANIILNVSLLSLPFISYHPSFSFLVLFERAILLLPHFGWLSLTDRERVNCITVSGIFLSVNAIILGKDLSISGVMQALSDGGFAVKALSWDAILGAAVSALLTWDGSV